MSHRYHIGLTLVSHRCHINITSVSHQPDAQIIAYYLRGAPQAIFLYYLREPPGCSTYRILPPRRAAGDFFILPPRASREPNYFTIKSCRGRSEIFHWKNSKENRTFFSYSYWMIYGFYESNSPGARRGGSKHRVLVICSSPFNRRSKDP